MTLPIAKFILR